MDFARQEKVPEVTFFKALQKKSRDVTIKMLQDLYKFQLTHPDDNGCFSVGLLIRNLATEEQEKELADAQMMKLKNDVKVPIRETLQGMFPGWADGIEKDEFIEAFENKGYDPWGVICLFHVLDYSDDAVDNKLDLETLVKILSKLKGVPYEKPAAGIKKTAQQENKIARNEAAQANKL